MRSRATKARIAFQQGIISVLMRMNAKPFKATTERKVKTEDEKVERDAPVIQGLARSYLKLKWTTLEKGRNVTLTGKPDEGLAAIACASLLKLDAASEGKITLTYDTLGGFSKTSQKAINDTIKSLRSQVEIIVKLKPAAQFKPNGPAN